MRSFADASCRESLSLATAACMKDVVAVRRYSYSCAALRNLRISGVRKA